MKKPNITKGEWYHQKIENPIWDKRDTSHYVASKTSSVICDLIADEFTPECKANDHAMRHVNRAYKAIPVVRAVSMLSYEYADQMMEARKA